MEINLVELGLAAGLPVLRSVAGWLENALKDKKITEFEWKMLVSTVIRVSVIGGAVYLGADGFGFDVDAIGASAAGVLGDMVFYSLKKLRPK